jgi:hypothetical protein
VWKIGWSTWWQRKRRTILFEEVVNRKVKSPAIQLWVSWCWYKEVTRNQGTGLQRRDSSTSFCSETGKSEMYSSLVLDSTKERWQYFHADRLRFVVVLQLDGPVFVSRMRQESMKSHAPVWITRFQFLCALNMETSPLGGDVTQELRTTRVKWSVVRRRVSCELNHIWVHCTGV